MSKGMLKLDTFWHLQSSQKSSRASSALLGTLFVTILLLLVRGWTSISRWSSVTAVVNWLVHYNNLNIGTSIILLPVVPAVLRLDQLSEAGFNKEDWAAVKQRLLALDMAETPIPRDLYDFRCILHYLSPQYDIQ